MEHANTSAQTATATAPAAMPSPLVVPRCLAGFAVGAVVRIRRDAVLNSEYEHVRGALAVVEGLLEDCPDEPEKPQIEWRQLVYLCDPEIHPRFGRARPDQLEACPDLESQLGFGSRHPEDLSPLARLMAMNRGIAPPERRAEIRELASDHGLTRRAWALIGRHGTAWLEPIVRGVYEPTDALGVIIRVSNLLARCGAPRPPAAWVWTLWRNLGGTVDRYVLPTRWIEDVLPERLARMVIEESLRRDHLGPDSDFAQELADVLHWSALALPQPDRNQMRSGWGWARSRARAWAAACRARSRTQGRTLTCPSAGFETELWRAEPVRCVTELYELGVALRNCLATTPERYANPFHATYRLLDAGRLVGLFTLWCGTDGRWILESARGFANGRLSNAWHEAIEAHRAGLPCRKPNPAPVAKPAAPRVRKSTPLAMPPLHEGTRLSIRWDGSPEPGGADYLTERDGERLAVIRKPGIADGQLLDHLEPGATMQELANCVLPDVESLTEIVRKPPSLLTESLVSAKDKARLAFRIGLRQGLLLDVMSSNEVANERLPKYPGRRASYLASAEWSWSPMHSRQDHYHLAYSRKAGCWILWIRFHPDEGLRRHDWTMAIAARTDHRDARQIATWLLWRYWRAERGETIDRPHHMEGLLPMVEIADDVFRNR